MIGQRLSFHTVTAVLSSVMLVLLGTSVADEIPTSREKGSMTIHKLQNAIGGEPSTGVEDRTIDYAEYPPLSGITYTIRRIESVDFSDVDGWKDLELMTAALTPGNPADGDGLGDLGAATSLVTSASGLAVFANLSTGAYLVHETAGNGISGDPFIVTIPMPCPNDPAVWNYDVHVYPASQVVKAEIVIGGDDATLSAENVGQTRDSVPSLMEDKGIILITGVGMLLALLSVIALLRGRTTTNT